jgi:uncharacterized repeat protein (TIGR03833 family)
MNSARNANRSNRGPSSDRGRGQGRGRGRGRGRGGHSRGGFNDHNDGDSPLKPVPTTQQVIVGAPVSIVLKVDQPTGREVQGIVAELLTIGNHPRGIKVRLQDGRVGRVQRMASEEAAKAGSAGMSGLGRNGEMSGSNNDIAIPGSSTFSGRHYGDFRVDEPDEPPSEGLSLEDYMVVKGKGKAQRKRGNKSNLDWEERPGNILDLAPAMVMCPVCGEFEGDEAAVAHHVNTHFE